MSSDLNKNITRTDYQAHSGDTILSEVKSIICVAMPGAMVAAGYDEKGNVLLIHGARDTQPVWSAAFIEHELLNDPLLLVPEMIKAVFIVSDKNLIIPSELFSDAAIARKWMSDIFHCEHGNKLELHNMEAAQSWCCFEYPEEIQQIFNKYIHGVKLLPINYLHFRCSKHANNKIQCSVLYGSAVATLYHNGILHWHQTFEYETAEDIAYRLALACRSFNIDHHSYKVEFTSLSNDLQPFLNRLREFFPEGTENVAADYGTTITLFQQLYSCVS